MPIAKMLPDRAARLYLALQGWDLPPLRRVSTAPLLASDGMIRAAAGYEVESGLWCANVPELTVPDRPTLAEAQSALQQIRQAFRTFPFADAEMVVEDKVPVVDTTRPPGLDESGVLVGLLTAMCRPSLPLAPGLLVSAPSISGAGTGKGLLIRVISEIAYGVEPRAFTPAQKDRSLRSDSPRH
jgi:hypothetical protein